MVINWENGIFWWKHHYFRCVGYCDWSDDGRKVPSSPHFSAEKLKLLIFKRITSPKSLEFTSYESSISFKGWNGNWSSSCWDIYSNSQSGQWMTVSACMCIHLLLLLFDHPHVPNYIVQFLCFCCRMKEKAQEHEQLRDKWSETKIMHGVSTPQGSKAYQRLARLHWEDSPPCQTQM